MEHCNSSNKDIVRPIKACSGKCSGAGCSSDAYIWVVAACEGMISLFAKHQDGRLPIIFQGTNAVASSVEEFRKFISAAFLKQSFSQLILVGSPQDLSWLRASLPENVAKYTVAEMKYPLIPNWFQQAPDMGSLSKAINQLFTP